MKRAVTNANSCLIGASASSSPSGWSLRLTIKSPKGNVWPSCEGIKTGISEGVYTVSISCKGRFDLVTSVQVAQGAVYKTIPSLTLELIKYGIYSGIFNPRAQQYLVPYKIQEGDIYQNGGWTAQGILYDLGIEYSIPSAVEYDVSGVTIMTGTPIVSVVRRMFPVVGRVLLAHGRVVTTGKELDSRTEISFNTSATQEDRVLGTDTITYSCSVIGGYGPAEIPDWYEREDKTDVCSSVSVDQSDPESELNI